MSEADESQVPAGTPGESEESPGISAGLQAELDRCRAPLRDFAQAPDGHPGFAYSNLEAARFDIPSDRLPVIASIHLTMWLLIGAQDLGRAEKLAWEYAFTFRGRVCSLSREKFGLRLYLGLQEGMDNQADKGEIVQKLSAAARLLERNVLPSLIDSQVKENRLLVHNQVGSLRRMYQYFRGLAVSAYAGDGVLAKRYDENNQGGVIAPYFRYLPEQQEGFFATVGMITAYFSLLEHLFVYALAVTDFDPAEDSLKEFIGDPLLKKFKRLFDLAQDRTAERYYKRLHDVAEKWRNPYSHGGFDKADGSLSIVVPGLGAIPLMLSDIRTHPTFHFLPERETSFDEVTALFDEMDTWLRQSQVGPGFAWADAGLPISFEPERLEEMRQIGTLGGYLADPAT